MRSIFLKNSARFELENRIWGISFVMYLYGGEPRDSNRMAILGSVDGKPTASFKL